jgi:GAF domain-containing protein
MNKKQKYEDVLRGIHAQVDGEGDVITVMSTVACAIKARFPHFNWVGFYRLVDDTTLKVGPYQGGHGCLTININRGVCGKCVRDKAMQLHNDISLVADHIACDSDTEAEIVFPIFDCRNALRAVFDIDSTTRNCFDDMDVAALRQVAALVGGTYS